MQHNNLSFCGVSHFIYCYAECHYAVYHYAECECDACHNAVSLCSQRNNDCQKKLHSALAVIVLTVMAPRTMVLRQQ
jgi:hypothetical protein